MFCRKFGNRWRASGGRDPGPVTPWSLLFFLCGLGAKEIFPCPGDSLALWFLGSVLERW